MAVQKYHNIVGSTATVTSLVPIGSKSPPIKSIVITNTRDSDTDATVSLFLQNDPDTGKFLGKHLCCLMSLLCFHLITALKDLVYSFYVVALIR